MLPDATAPRLVRDPAEWRDLLAARADLPLRGQSTAREVFVVSPTGFSLAAESATDNAYMASGAVDVSLALRQHADMSAAIGVSLPVTVFPGHAETPDAVFPNNVFASVPGKLIIGAMRHPVRQRESVRSDIPDWFAQHHGYRIESLQGGSTLAELTGCLIIDHARNLGYCGISERVNESGLHAMLDAFGLDAMFAFDLAPGEYHTNVVMSVLAGRAVVMHASSFVDPEVPRAIAAGFGDCVYWLSDAEKAGFVGNCIALRPDEVWMSERAAQALSVEHRAQFQRQGFAVRSADISEIEKAGGSLRCCIAEVW